jgi:predicted metal-dependent peptidase
MAIKSWGIRSIFDMSKDHPRWTEIKVAMLVHVPFFSSLLFDLMDVQIGKFPNIFGGIQPPTAATDGKRIYIDEDFLSKLKLPEAVFLVCHEIGHAMWMHMARAKRYADLGFEGEPFDARRWNYAGDYIINDMLKSADIGTMPQGGLLDAKYRHDMQIEDVYRELKDDMPPQKCRGVALGNGDGNQAEQDGNDGGTMDVHIHNECEINDAEMHRAVQTAVNTAKAMGKLPASLGRFAEEFLKPQVSWQERLRYHVTRAIARDATTWTKPNRRRLVMQNLYLPAYTGFGAGHVLVVVDTSGSIGQAELNTFFSELDDILMTCNPTGVTLLGCDAQVSSEHHLQAGDSLKGQKIELGGGGGTSFIPPFDWANEHGMRPEALIYFTDMYGAFPEQEPDFPVIWCRTSDVNPPWGEVIDVKIT